MAQRSGESRLGQGLGLPGLVAAGVIGAVVLLPPLLSRPASPRWASVLLFAAAAVYVVLALLRDRRQLRLTGVQLAVAAVLAVTAAETGLSAVVAAGLLAHAAWDLWHLATPRDYAPAWYAGACVYVDIAAAGLVLVLA